MRYSKLLLIVAFVGAVALAQDAPVATQQIVSKDQTREFTERFLNKLVSSARVYDAFALLKQAAPDSEGELDNIRRDTEALFDEVRPSYGKVVGYDGLGSKALGQSMIRYDYLLKFERNAVHMRIVYYQPRKTWMPILIAITRDLDLAWDELSK